MHQSGHLAGLTVGDLGTRIELGEREGGLGQKVLLATNFGK